MAPKAGFRFLALALLGLSACADEATAPVSPDEAAPALARGGAGNRQRAIPDHYVITFKDDVRDPEALAKRLAAAPGDTLLFVYQHALKGFAARLSPASVKGLGHEPQVEVVLPDELGEMDQSGTLWSLDRLDQRGLPLDAVYAPPRDGTGVNLYVIDSGVRKSHREFDWGLRARHGYTAISDGRGSEDCYGHGTHVAATAAGTTYGAAKKATVWAVRIGDCTGSATVSRLLAALDWLAANRVTPAVANLSYTFSARSDIDDATRKVISAGVTFVTSAGNNNADACNYSPKRLSGVLTVAGTTSGDWRHSTSNWGSCVKVFAPGVDVLSAWNGSDTDTRTLTGTSMASPHVAGIAALFLQGDPGAAPWKVQDAIQSSATKDVVVDAKGSPNRLLYAFPVYFGVQVSGPGSINASGSHTWEAMPEGGDGSYTYQWSVYYTRDGSTQSLGTGKTQTLYVNAGSGDFEMRVTSTSAGQSKSASQYVYNASSGGCSSGELIC
jgi:subtilisin family serine protease